MISYLDDNLFVLQQGAQLLSQIEDSHYVTIPTGFGRSSIGAHIRHCLDVYQALVQGVETGRVDYDARQRDLRIEQERLFAVSRMEKISSQLVTWNSRFVGVLPILARQDSPFPAEDPRAWSSSSLSRELQATLSHTIHHYALVAVGLRLQGIAVPADFGVAPATLAYWKQLA
jgi:hypothetical protein